MHIIQSFIKSVQTYPDKPAIFFKDRAITFKELEQKSVAVARFFDSLNAPAGTKVAVYLPTIPEYVYTYTALYAAGMTVVPFDFMLTQDELIGLLNHVSAEYLVAFPRKGIDWSVLLEKTRVKKIIMVSPEPFPSDEKVVSFDDIQARAAKHSFPEMRYREDAPSTIFYTSGTTGMPKGVVLSYRHLEAPPEAFKYFLDLKDSDVSLCTIPLSHVGGLDLILILYRFGVPVVLMERFQPLEFLRQIEKHRVSLFCIVPSMYTAIVSLKEFDTLPIDLSSLRYAVVFGAPSTPELLKRFHRRCPMAHLLNGWGMTETAAPNTVTPPGSDNIASVGKPVPWMQLKIVDEDERPLPVGERGHLLIKGWPVFSGYYGNESLTKESFTKDGYFKTGDVAYFDEDGYLYIVGRIKEIIKVGGQLVFAPEVESHIARHPAVYETAVIGIPDQLRGEVPKAYVVCKEGQQVSEHELRDFLKAHVAHFKMPHVIEFRTALPKNRMGKINKEELKKELNV